MSDELFYTSAPRGLRPGTSGFCTVAATPSLGAAWIERLEALSGYKPIFPAGDPNESQNPVAFSHTRVTIAGKTRSVLSRVCFSGFDHTGRSNKFAHHLVLADAERSPAGPAAMLQTAGVLTSGWDGGEPRALSPRRLPASTTFGLRIATAWQDAAGDAGWAGHLASITAEDSAAAVYIIYPEHVDALELAAEALAIMPAAKLWQVTFNTYVTESLGGTVCAWRFIRADSSAVALARGKVIDLTDLSDTTIASNDYVAAARSGKPIVDRQPDAQDAEVQRIRQPFAEKPRAIDPFEIASGSLPRGQRGALPPTVPLQKEQRPAVRGVPLWPFLLAGVVVLLVILLSVTLISKRSTIASTAGESTTAPTTSATQVAVITTQPAVTSAVNDPLLKLPPPTAMSEQTHEAQPDPQVQQTPANPTTSDARPDKSLSQSDAATEPPAASTAPATTTAVTDKSPQAEKSGETTGSAQAGNAAPASTKPSTTAPSAETITAQAQNPEDTKAAGNSPQPPLVVHREDSVSLDSGSSFLIENASQVSFSARPRLNATTWNPKSPFHISDKTVTFKCDGRPSEFTILIDEHDVIHCDFKEKFASELLARPSSKSDDESSRIRAIQGIRTIELSLSFTEWVTDPKTKSKKLKSDQTCHLTLVLSEKR